MTYSYDRTAASKTAGETWNQLTEEYRGLIEDGDFEGLKKAEAKTVREYVAAMKSLQDILDLLQKSRDGLQDATLPDTILVGVWPTQQSATEGLWRTIKGFEETMRVARRVAAETEAWFSETIMGINPKAVLFHWPNR